MRGMGGSRFFRSMRLLTYIASVFAIAAALTGGLFAMEPTLTLDGMLPLLMLSVLALVAEILAFFLPQSARGSIAFIPYITAILLMPSWITCLAVLLVKLISELPRHNDWLKKSFNVASHVLAAAAGAWAFHIAGGESLLRLSGATLLEATYASGLAACAAFVASMVANYAAVCGVIAISSQRPVLEVWRQNTASSIAMAILASPVIFLFGWVYAAHGPILAAAMWVPILGFRQITSTNLELEQMNRELLQLMVKSIEARDTYTSGHSRRVQEYATAIARGLKLAESEIDKISQAALLHDVGKINEKYHPILTKPDRLTPVEWAIMKEHPIDGANLVGTMTRLRHLIPAIRHHHENWDGTGYPDGIAGELIPLEARVIAIADTIDAMSSERPYRPGLSPEQVRAEIVRCRGMQFDPRIADRVLSSDVWSRLFPDAEPTIDRSGGPKLVRELARVG